ncbi:BglG family transcription antiterminator [Oenococcus sp.]|uniref:BglG family transcription antiterminator n=1 Tax=Oenococcus sp. TaxID=1979414 RepID=UPI0039E7D2EB
MNTILENEDLNSVTNVKTLGFLMSDDAREYLMQVQNKENVSKEGFFNFSQTQRINTIIWFLINKQTMSLSLIEKKFHVSRNTADQDFKKIQRTLSKYSLKLSKNSHGHTIQGSEIQQRKWIYEQFLDGNPILFSLLDRHTAAPQNIGLLLRDFEQITGNFFTDDAFVCLTAFLQWYIERIKAPENRIPNENVIPDNLVALEWAQKLLFQNDVVNLGEARYLINLVHSSQFRKANTEYGGIQDILPIAKQIIFKFNQITGINLKLDSLQASLATHLLSAYYRIKLDISYQNENLSLIQVKYHDLFTFTELAMKPFQEFIQKKIPEDEVALVTLYFGGALKAIEDEDLKRNSNTVMIVCSSGVGTSRILKQQLEERFPEISFSRPFNLLSFENSSLINIKLIISTIKINQKNLKIPNIKVSAIPTLNDWNNINNALKTTGLIREHKNKINVEGLLDIISEYARITDLDALTESIDQYLVNANSNSKNAKKQILNNGKKLTDIFLPKDIQFSLGAKNFDEALVSSFKTLLADHSIEERYIDRIRYLNTKFNFSMTLGQNIFLAHAGPEDGVNKTAFAFLMLKEPVYLYKNQSNEKIPIKIFISFGTVDGTSHLGRLNDIMQLISNKQEMLKICSTNSRLELLNLT